MAHDSFGKTELPPLSVFGAHQKLSTDGIRTINSFCWVREQQEDSERSSICITSTPLPELYLLIAHFQPT